MDANLPGRADAATPVPVPFGELFELARDAEAAGQTERAERLLGHLRAVAPDQPDALHLAGIVAFRRKNHQEALVLMQRSLAHGLDQSMYLRNICEVYRVLGRFDEALASVSRALELSPGDPLGLHNQAMLLAELGRYDEAVASARAALLVQPDMAAAHFLLAEIALLRGEMAEGWEEYEWRFRLSPSAMPAMPKSLPHWDGAPLAGRLMVVADQGVGDVIQFSRYLPWAAARCGGLTVVCRENVRPLLRLLLPDLRCVETIEFDDACAAHVSFSGLPRLHGTRLDNVPAPAPGLRPTPEAVAGWRVRLDQLVPAGFARVGIVWAGNPEHSNDRNRSARLADFAPLAALPGVALISLQKGAGIEQVSGYFGRAPLVNIGASVRDYLDTMALLEAVDLLVTIDSSVAHLAGAMGRPAWVLLPRAPDWRWLLGRDDSPWYPSVRLFRQGEERAWQPVLQAVAAALGTG